MVGEGAGILILEELETAKRRGARILAEIVGYGMSADAHHVTAPSEDGDGAYRVMRNALRDAGVEPAQIDYINAHGTSTELGDRIETMAIKRCFGEYASKVAVSSTKSMTGHLLGGAGGLEAGITVMAIRDQVAPPTVNYETPDPECDQDYVAQPFQAHAASSWLFPGRFRVRRHVTAHSSSSATRTNSGENCSLHQAGSGTRFSVACGRIRRVDSGNRFDPRDQ